MEAHCHSYTYLQFCMWFQSISAWQLRESVWFLCPVLSMALGYTAVIFESSMKYPTPLHNSQCTCESLFAELENPAMSYISGNGKCYYLGRSMKMGNLSWMCFLENMLSEDLLTGYSWGHCMLLANCSICFWFVFAHSLLYQALASRTLHQQRKLDFLWQSWYEIHSRTVSFQKTMPLKMISYCITHGPVITKTTL